MKYFLDTEFIESPGSIQLISIGIVAENGRTFYAESTSFDERTADDWVKENVLSALKFWTIDGIDARKQHIAIDDDESIEMFGTLTAIRNVLLTFFEGDSIPEFWGYFADYDWVVFCWIFGRMIDLPTGFPKYCRDLKQMLDESDISNIAAPLSEHNSLADALWNKELYDYLVG